MSTLLALSLAVLIGAHAVQIATAALTLHRLGRTRRAPPDALPAPRPAVTVLAPVDRVTAASERCMGSIFRLHHRPLEILFCAAGAEDSALSLATRLRSDHPETDAKILVGRETVSRNPKLDNLEKGWSAARHSLVLIIDDNVEVPPDLIARLLERWDETTGLACTVVVGTDPGSFWAEVECAWLGPFQARLLFASDLLTRTWAMGKAMLLPRPWFEAEGGISALRAFPAEDGGASIMAHRHGLRTRYADVPVEQPLGRRTFREVCSRQLRWAILRRHQVPAVFLLEPLATGFLPMAAAASAASLSGLSAPAAALASLGLWLAVDALLGLRAGWPTGWKSPLASLARDAGIVAVWALAWIRRGYTWRGEGIRLDG